MKTRVVIHKSKYGYDVSCPGLPGCASQGETYDEAIENIKSAIKEYLLAMGDQATGPSDHPTI